MTLYEIDSRLESIMDIDGTKVDAESGEIIEAEALDALNMARDEKIDNILCFIKNLNAEAAALKAEREKLEAREKAAKNKADALKRYLAAHMDEGEKWHSVHGAIGWRKSQSVAYTDIESIPLKFVVTKKEYAKKDIFAALKAGEEVPGATLETKRTIQIK